MKRQIANKLGPVLAALLFGAALFILHRQLRDYNYRDILASVRQQADTRVLVAVLLTAVSYLLLTCYDVLALRYIGRSLPYPVAAMAGFVGYAFSNSGGFPMVTGGSVRYRVYSSWGLTALDVGLIMIFATITFWLGFFMLGSISFLSEPLPLPSVVPLPFATTEPLGFMCLGVVLAYFGLCAIRRTPVRVRNWEVRLPSVRLAMAQVAVASADMLAAAGVFYVLLPADAGVSYPVVLGVFVLGILAGLVSQVPGGLGVFETIVVLLLQPYVSGPPLVASLLAFRAVYYLLPLAGGAAVLGLHEAYLRRRLIVRASRWFGPWVPLVAPQVLSLTVFIGGAILLFSGAMPAIHGRLAFLEDFVPLPAIEVSHFVASLAGMGLLLLARGLQQRVDAAYYGAALLLSTGIVTSILKGLDYEEALVLTVMLAGLLPCRPFFYRRASLFRPRLTPGWATAIAVVLIATGWMLLFAYKHIEYRHELWWQFAFFSHASRSMRAAVGACGLLFFFTLGKLLTAAPPEPVFPGPAELDRAAGLVARSPRTEASLALLGDKLLLFSEDERAFLMYGVYGRSWVALSDPVGDDHARRELIWRFREICDRHGAWTVFYEITDRWLPLYLDIGLTLMKLGEEARVDLSGFSLEGSAHKDLRSTCRKLEREGASFELVPPEAVPGIMSELRAVSDAWLAEKNTREKKFSLGSFKEDYVVRFPQAVVRREGRIVAFANVWRGAEGEEASIDLMRYSAEAPSGIMDYLFANLMVRMKEEGYQWFNLGMAPLSGLESRSLAPLWHRVGALVFRHGEHFYNFRGLRQYKEKFNPVWRPRYLATPGGLAVPRVLANVAALVSGGLTGAVRK